MLRRPTNANMRSFGPLQRRSLLRRTSRTFNPMTHHSLLRTTLSVFLVIFPSLAVAARHEHIVDSWRPTNFNVVITLNDGLTEITKARTEITVQVLKDNLAVVDLDFGEMPVDSVTLNGKAAQFDRTPDRLNVRLPKPASKGGHF